MLTKPIKKIFVIGFFAFAAPVAQAVVNIEDQRSATAGKHYSLDLSVSGASGNTDKIAADLSAKISEKKGAITDLAIVSVGYGESNGATNTDKVFFHLRRTVQEQKDLAWESFLQAEKNEFTRLSFRGLLGGGARFPLSSEAGKTQFFIGTGAFYVTENLKKSTTLTDGGTETLWRGNFYLNYQAQLSQQLRFNSTLYYQPALSDTGDYRAVGEVSMAVNATENFDIKLSLDFSTDSKPPQTVEKTDVFYKTSLIIRY